ncbi:MAG: methionyl-tRNA formyltransferase [Myxococcota bacterium]
MAFFGTPDIARVVLERLLDDGSHPVVRVYCQPDRPKGRGKKLVAPPVKVLAESRGLPVEQPRKLKDGTVAAQLREDDIDLAVVVAYGRILPVDLFEAPRFDTWNVHASLLPKYRGASPIQHAILGGEDETGVTLMQLGEGLDEGPMLLARRLPIDADDTAGRLTEKLADLGARTLVEGLSLAQTEGLEIVPQNDDEATFAPLIDKKDGELDFTQPAASLARRIRGFDPWPGTFVRTEAGPLKIIRAVALAGSESQAAERVFEPGQIVSREPLCMQTGEGQLEIRRLQAPGRKPIDTADFLRGVGRKLSIGDRLQDC